MKFKLNIIPNVKGETPLHICLKKKHSKEVEMILKEISKYPFDDHIKFIKDAFPEALKLSPTVFGDYLDARIIKPAWSISYTKGDLITHHESCSFGSMCYNMYINEPEDIEKKLFTGGEDVRLPLNLRIIDIPNMHTFNESDSRRFMEALTENSHVESLF